MKEYKEKQLKTTDGWTVFIAILFLWILFLTINIENNMLIMLGVITTILSPGFVIVKPNQGVLCTTMGNYSGVITKEGFYWINPIDKIIKVSTKIQTHTIKSVPIKIEETNCLLNAVIIWKIENITKAKLMLENHEKYAESMINIMTNTQKYKISDSNIELIIQEKLNNNFIQYGLKIVNIKVDLIILK